MEPKDNEKTFFQKYISNTPVYENNNKLWRDHKYSTCYTSIFSITSYLLIGILLYDLLTDWYYNTAKRFFKATSLPLSGVPFPAVTICLNDPIYSKTVNLTTFLEWKGQNKTDQELQFLNFIYSMCSWKHTVDKVAKIDQEIVFKVLKEYTTKCEETILQIRWLGKIIHDPCSIMQPFILLSQLCFSFNALPYYEMYKQTPYKLQDILEIGTKWSESKIDWNLDKGYNNENSSKPLRINSSGLRNSVEFVLAQKESGKGCSRNSGFIAYFHNPSDVPDYSHTSFAFSKGTHSFVQFKTYLSVTDQSLGSWTPEDRGCYFSDERPLMLTKIYSKTNCYYECQINYTQNICGCTPYYFITDSLPVCGLRMEYCFINASLLAEGTTDICKCLPPCTQYDYSISYSTVPKDFENAQHSLPFLNNFTDSNYTNFASIEVHTYHDNMWPLGRAVEGSAIKRWGELTAVISLCLGVSFITIIEYIYYAVVRPIVMNVL